jgi:hypothetical protein
MWTFRGGVLLQCNRRLAPELLCSERGRSKAALRNWGAKGALGPSEASWAGGQMLRKSESLDADGLCTALLVSEGPAGGPSAQDLIHFGSTGPRPRAPC